MMEQQWTEVADLATAISGGSSGKSGTQTATFYAGGALVPAFTTGNRRIYSTFSCERRSRRTGLVQFYK